MPPRLATGTTFRKNQHVSSVLQQNRLITQRLEEPGGYPAECREFSVSSRLAVLKFEWMRKNPTIPEMRAAEVVGTRTVYSKVIVQLKHVS
jgi:hypothetical protein